MADKEKFALMILRASAILIAVVLGLAAINELRKANIRANDESGAVAEIASTANTPNPHALTPPHEVYSHSVSSHVEPFLLLLLGSILFSIGTAIKLVLSRRLNPKAMAAASRKPPSTQC